MSVWFEGEIEIDCSTRDVQRALENLGEFYVGVIALMPGLTSVELVEQTSDSVIIRTNEGLMHRTNITKRIEAESVVVELDERYEAGSKVTATAHFSDSFTATDTGVVHRLVISDIEAPGFLGFFYRRFGSSKIGNAFLAAHKPTSTRRPISPTAGRSIPIRDRGESLSARSTIFPAHASTCRPRVEIPSQLHWRRRQRTGGACRDSALDETRFRCSDERLPTIEICSTS